MREVEGIGFKVTWKQWEGISLSWLPSLLEMDYHQTYKGVSSTQREVMVKAKDIITSLRKKYVLESSLDAINIELRAMVEHLEEVYPEAFTQKLTQGVGWYARKQLVEAYLAEVKVKQSTPSIYLKAILKEAVEKEEEERAKQLILDKVRESEKIPLAKGMLISRQKDLKRLYYLAGVEGKLENLVTLERIGNKYKVKEVFVGLSVHPDDLK